VTGSSIALLLLLYMDDAMVAAMLGAGALAVYQMAYQVAGIPASEISLVVGEVAFTSMSRLRDEPARLARSFLQSYELVAALSIPIAIALAVTASPTIALLLGPRWDGAIAVIQVLAAWGVLRALGSLTTALFKAVGRPDIPARHHWRMVLCTGVLLVPMIEVWGIVGAAVAVLVPNLIIHWLRYRDVAMVLGIRQERILERLQGPAIAGAVMGVAMVAVCVGTASWWPGWTLLGACAIGAAAYVGTMALMERAGRSTSIRSAWLLTKGTPA
jgi:PST family polysaccharide transporter/lipopolysaccharide exporter